MGLLFQLPLILCLVFVFVFGLIVGSFLNVLIARLPYEKSVFWPGSRCGACLQPIRLRDNLPIVGYLLLRGRCRNCGVRFSSRYLWVELGTGLAFLGLFVLEVLENTQRVPGLADAGQAVRNGLLPTPAGVVYFAAHACLLSLLIAAAVIDAGHRIIPPQITYPGVVVGLAFATACPWPWPSDPALAGQLPTGLTLWPFADPLPNWAPPGSGQLGLLNGLIGAAVGTGLIRVIKFLFEFGFGQEALGLGDADLLMMAGAFLGWQPVVLGFVAGVFLSVAFAVPPKLLRVILRWGADRELSFGPGLAAGVVLVWLGWPWARETARLLFDPLVVGFGAGFICLGLFAAGLLLRR